MRSFHPPPQPPHLPLPGEKIILNDTEDYKQNGENIDGRAVGDRDIGGFEFIRFPLILLIVVALIRGPFHQIHGVNTLIILLFIISIVGWTRNRKDCRCLVNILGGYGGWCQYIVAENASKLIHKLYTESNPDRVRQPNVYKNNGQANSLLCATCWNASNCTTI